MTRVVSRRATRGLKSGTDLRHITRQPHRPRRLGLCRVGSLSEDPGYGLGLEKQLHARSFPRRLIAPGRIRRAGNRSLTFGNRRLSLGSPPRRTRPASDGRAAPIGPLRGRIWQPRAMRCLAATSLVCFIAAGCGGGESSGSHPARPKSRSAVPANGPVVLGAKNFIVWVGSALASLTRASSSLAATPRSSSRASAGTAGVAGAHRESGATRCRTSARAATTTASGFVPTCGSPASAGCSRNGPRTYMALKVRVALRPGQRPSWYEADGSHGLCSYP